MHVFGCLPLRKLCGNGSKSSKNQTKSSEAAFSYEPTQSSKAHFDDPTRFDKTHSEDPTRSDKTHFNGRTPSKKVHFDNPTSSDKEIFKDPTLSDKARLDDPTLSDKTHLEDPIQSEKAHVDGPTPSNKPHFNDPTNSDKTHFEERTRVPGPLKLPLQEIKSVTNNFDVDNFIGKGVLGKIYEGQLPAERGAIEVAVRRLDHSFWLQELAFEKEISILSRLKHDNMVSMVGYCYENNEMLIVNERVALGSLTFHLSDHELTWMRRLQIGVGVVRALSYLHSNSIIHHNINSDSVLLDEKWQAKISGFEFSMTTAGAGKLDLAYEKLGMGTYKSDVFSVGILLFELLCGKKAFVSENDNRFQASLALFHYENRTLNNLVDPDLFKQMDQLSFNIFSETAYYCLNKHGAVLNMNQVRKSLERALDVQQKHDKNEQSTVPFERTRPEHLKLKLKSLEHMRIRLADIMSATENFTKGFVAGGFGSVYTAELEHVHKEYCIENEWENEHEVPKTRSIVAIKRINDTESLIAEQGFYAEIEMLTSCKHSNIIPLLGFCDEGRSMILIYEYASNGSLNYYLQSLSNNPNDSWAQRVRICLGAANGISCLHTTQGDRQEIVHRDIKSANILLDENFEAKIGDFGLSIFPSVSEENYNAQYTRKALGTPVYMDPQYRKDGRLKIKSDVYSFGVVMLEILCGTVAYDRKYAEENSKGLVSVARQHFRKGTIMEMVDPRLKEEATETQSRSNRGPNQESLNTFSKIAFDCLAGAQAKRPTMEDVVRELKKALFFQAGPLERLKIPLNDIQIATKKFTQGLLAGAYGNVYHAELELTVIEKATGEISKKRTDVAIKCITKSHRKEGFDAEIEFLSSCKHTNLVSLLGYCNEGPNMILVYEHASSKSLDTYFGSTDSSTNLTWVQRIKIGIDIARGLDYLHTRRVDDEKMRIHHDIKSSNILLCKNMVVKIADTGLSRFHRANQQEKTLRKKNIAGTNLYLCPEDNEDQLTTAVDIYSFGVVLFEILSGKLASDQTFLAEDVKGIAHVARVRFEEQKLNEMVDRKIMEEVNELKSVLHKGPNQDSLKTFLDIAYKCIAEDQSSRPTAKEILDELNKALSYQENNKDSLQIPLDEIKLATDNFSSKYLIGKGGFGNVYIGEVAHGNEITTIVAKRLDRIRGQGEEQFLMELEILFDYKHDKIISLEGYCNENGEKIIVCEYASNGSLDERLNNASLTWTKRLKICIDIAHGLAFLHDSTDSTQEMVIHRDIKSSNILLNADWRAKISDFGLSVITAINQEVVDYPAGTPGYIDPQYMNTGVLTEKSDIYSLGVVLFEILHGSVIYKWDHNQTPITSILEDIHEEEKLGSIVFEDIKGQIDPESLSIFRVIVSQCLNIDREKRPTAKKVLQQLEESLEFQEDYENWGSKMPEDYEEILKLSTYSEKYSTEKKKDVYSLLSEGILLQDDTLLFTLGENGERNEMISARTFSYINGSPHDNWCINVPNSRFKMVAQMLDISDLMIKIETRAQFISQNTSYGVYLVFKFCDSRNVPRTPIYVDLKYRKGNENLHAYFAKWRDDEWMMIELYRFLNHKDDGDFEVLIESLSTYYCREHDAIYVKGIEFRPIDNAELQETEKTREIQQVLESNSNLDQALQTPTKSEMILKGSINYDYGEELLSLTEVNGKKHLMLSAKAALNNFSDLTLFNSKPSPESRFKEVFELLPQHIFRINCMIKSQMLSQDTEYACYLVFKLSEKCHELHGPVEVRDLLQKYKDKVAEFVYFRTPSPWNIHNITRVPKQRKDGWMEVNFWKFNSSRELDNDCVRMNLKLISYEGSMSGLIVCGLEFRPM